MIYEIFLSPLRKVPGPIAMKISSLPLDIKDLKGDRTQTIHELHSQYGPIVRIGPNEVSISDASAIKEIYRQGTDYMKTPFYNSNFGVHNNGIFNLQSRNEHSQRRKLLSNIFSTASLEANEAQIRESVGLLMNRIDAMQKVNGYLWFRFLALDIVGSLFFGQSFGTLEKGEAIPFVHDIDYLFIYRNISQKFPLIKVAARYLTFTFLHHMMGAAGRVQNYGKSAYYSYVDKIDTRKQQPTLLAKMIDLRGTGLTDEQLYCEATNLIFAGADTTANTLLYTVWELAKHPSLQARLRQALSPPSSDNIYSYDEVKDNKYLLAIINEGLRLHPAAPGSLFRYVPPKGRVLSGVFLPERTIVSMQCYTTHRDARVFPLPDQYNPERWMSPISDDMKLNFMPFSKGPRACLGINMAWIELAVTLASLVYRYEISLGDMPDDAMDMKDHFIILPKGKQCSLIFSRP